MTTNEPQLAAVQRRALVVALVGLGLSAALSWGEPDRLWRAYLFAFLPGWLITMGGMGLLAIGNLTGGRWATAARPAYLAQLQALPLVAILFIPIALTLPSVYPWAAHPTTLELPPGKAQYLSIDFFRGRAIGYFVVWLGVAWWLARVSRWDLPPASTPAMRRAGALSLVFLAPTATFAAFDWGMSLEPEWYSSIYGAIMIASGVLAAHGLAICGLATCQPFGRRAVNTAVAESDPHDPLTAVAERSLPSHPAAAAFDARAAEIFNDLGNLLLAFVMVFAYFSFSQFLIIWSGNLPSEIAWYRLRLQHGWQWLALAVVLLMFFVPFSNLLSRDVKRSPLRLARVAALLVVMHVVHLYWAIIPALPETGIVWLATNVAALATLSGGWLAAVVWHAKRYESELPPSAAETT
jgi:hypothetical protein